MRPITRDEFAELIRNARIRPRLARELRFVPEKVTNWPDRDFLVVMNKSQAEGVVIASGARLAAFRLFKRTPNNTGRIEAIICDICATWQPGTHSAVLNFEKEASSVSFLVCGDLNCSLHVRDKTAAARRSRVQLRETITLEGRIERLRKCLSVILEGIEEA